MAGRAAKSKERALRLSRQRRKELRFSTADARYREVVGLVNRGSILTDALEQAGLSRKKFKALNEGGAGRAGYHSITATGEARPGQPKYQVSDKTLRKKFLIIDSAGEVRSVAVTGKDRNTVTKYNDAVNAALAMNNAVPLASFSKRRIKTIDGDVYILNTDLETIRHKLLIAQPTDIDDVELGSGTLALYLRMSP